ncbi:class I SAM-dependent methyltransferase [Chryseobacterium sp.]|uniref:class I SAM-dependent methyltransferase n=1 Tax=Chryseobacterium sp. TaxID=1871047 RepID=UPI00289A1D04|nr:class I SAM-dependent methyltransferase [Chryseobacterium sp.]
MNLIDRSIDSFYTKRQEENRLSIGLGPLEFERTKILINRYLNTSSHIVDVGGGPGHYAHWLAGMGHHVTLIDPVKKHIEQAKRRSTRGFQFTCLHGEARQIHLPDLSQDLVLLHGPLYHLQDLDERLAALQEAKRILKKGGVVLGFAITHSASTIATLQTGLVHDEKLFAMCISELQSGDHFPPENYPLMLAKVFCHRPSELVDEFETAGFEPLDLLPVEGIAWLDSHFYESWAETRKRNTLLELIKITEKDRELLCFSPHIMLAAKK